MKSINLLDCTLRDGGCVNDFNFGENYMNAILRGLEQSGVEIIECGYLDEEKGSLSGRTQFKDEKAIMKSLVRKKRDRKKYVAMVDYGKFDVRHLSQYSSITIDGIRLAFHKKDRKNMISCGKIILSKGYELYIQPMLVMRYSDQELLDLIEDVNNELSRTVAFYIVDSFGEMRKNDLYRIANLVHHNLQKDMMLGFHSHNNLQLSYSNATALLDFSVDRNLVFDVSVLGMGKGAGNLNAEIFAEHLNRYYEKNYNISSMLCIIDEVLNQIRQDYNWGYSVEYYLSSINHCSPSYASFFYDRHTLSIDDISILLADLKEEKRISFDREYANRQYFNFIGKKYDDSKTLEWLRADWLNRNIVLIAPGKSILNYRKQVQSCIEENNAVVITVNHIMHIGDYIFCTKKNILDHARNCSEKVLRTSNLEGRDEDLIINYDHYNESAGKKADISIILLLNLLAEIDIRKIFMAGFDGFRTDMDENYYDDNLRRPVGREQARERNRMIREHILKMKEKMDIQFITPSMYEEV